MNCERVNSTTQQSPPTGGIRRVRQRGAATLIVVMLAAAYASRNLIFEQRTSINQYQSTKASEAAEAGMEWALTMLNGGRIDENCVPTTDVTKDSFRQRYVVYNTATGEVRRTANSTDPTLLVWAACSFDGVNWSCSCPQPDGAVAASLPTGIAAFGVRFVNQPPLGKPGVVRIEVNGCNSYDLNCITGVQPGTTAVFCQSTACSLIAQFSALRLPPSAAITARGNVSGTFIVSNTDVTAGGVTVHAGGATPADPALTGESLAGIPPLRFAAATTRPNSAALSSLDADAGDCTNCLFTSLFGLRPDTYRSQPAAVVVDCSIACTTTSPGSELGKALAAERGSIVWLKGAGGLALTSAASAIGTIAKPVTLVVEGPVSLASGAKVVGFVYGASAVLNSGEIRGALASASTVNGSGSAQVTYDSTVLATLQKVNGSFVRVPGSWRDFP